MWSGKHTFRRNKSSSQRDSSGSQHTTIGVGYAGQESPNVNFSELGMAGDSYTDVSGSLGIKATTPSGKPNQKHNSFISSHVSNLWDRASSRRRAMSSGAKSNPPAILEVRPSMEKHPDPRDAVWTAASAQDPERRMSLRRVPSLTSLRKSSFSSSRQSHIPQAAMPVRNGPTPVSILRRPGPPNPVPPMPSGPPPILSPASVPTPRMPPPPPVPTGIPQPNGLQQQFPQTSTLPLPSGLPQPSTLPPPSGLPQLSGIPQPTGLPQPSSGLPQPRGRRTRPSGIYGYGVGPPVPDLSSAHGTHKRGGSISKTSEDDHGRMPVLAKIVNQDEEGRNSMTSYHSRSLSSTTNPSPMTEEASLKARPRSSIPAPTASLKTFPSGTPPALPAGDRRASRFNNDTHKNVEGPATMPPTRQEAARYSAKPLPPAPAGASAISRLPSLRSKVPITVSATPATHVRDHIRTNALNIPMPTMANVELTTPNMAVRQAPDPQLLPSAMDLFAVSQKLEDMTPTAEGYPEHYLRGSELAANNSLGLEESAPSLQSHTSLAYVDDGVDMSRTSSAPFSSIPMADFDRRNAEPATTKGTFGGWNTPGSYGTSTPVNDDGEFVFPVESKPSYLPVKDEKETMTRPRKDTFGSLDFLPLSGLVHAPAEGGPEHSGPSQADEEILQPFEYNTLVTPATPRTEEFADPVPVEYRPVVSPAPDAARPASGNWFKVGADTLGPSADSENTIELSSPDLDGPGRPASGSWFSAPALPKRPSPASEVTDSAEHQTPTQGTFSPHRFPSTDPGTCSPNSVLSPTAMIKGLNASPRRKQGDEDAYHLGSTEMVAKPSSEGHDMPVDWSGSTDPVPVRTWEERPSMEEVAKPAPIGTWPLQKYSPPSRSDTPELPELTDNEEERPHHPLRSAVTPVDWPILASVTSSAPPLEIYDTPAPSTIASPPSATAQLRQLPELSTGNVAEDDAEEVISFGSGPREVPRSFTTITTERAATPGSDDDIFISPPMAPYLSDTAPGTPSEYMTPFEEPTTASSETFSADESTLTDDAVTADEGHSDGFSMEDALVSLPYDLPSNLFPTRLPYSPAYSTRASSTTPRTARLPLTEFPFPPSPSSSPRSSAPPSTAHGLLNDSTPEPITLLYDSIPEPITPLQQILSPRRVPLPQSPTPATSSPSRPPPPSVDTLLARMDGGTSEPSPTDPMVVTPGVNDFPQRSRSASPKKESRLRTPPNLPSLNALAESPTDPFGITPRKAWSPLGVPGLSPEQEPAVADASFTLPLSTSTTADDLAGEAGKSDKAKQDTLDALEELMMQETQTQEHIREQGSTPVHINVAPSPSPSQSDLPADVAEISSIHSSPPVRIADLRADSLEEQHFATAPIASSLGEQMHAADDAEQNLFIPPSRSALFHHRKATSEPARDTAAGPSTRVVPDAIVPIRDSYGPYEYPYGSRMGLSAVSLSIEEPPHSATTASSRSSATFGLEYLRRSMDWSVDDESPYSYQRSLPNASKDSILLSSSPVRSPLALSDSSPVANPRSLPGGASPAHPALSLFGSPGRSTVSLGLGSPIRDPVRLEAPSPATQSLALAGAPLSASSLLLPVQATVAGLATRETPSPTETESRTISRVDTPVRDIATPVDSEPSPSRRHTMVISKRDTVISPASRALMVATGSADFVANVDSSSPIDTIPPTSRKRFSTPVRALTSPDNDIPSPSTTETGTTETGTTETIRASMSPVAAASLPKPVTRASSKNKARPPPLRPTFFAPPPLNSDGNLLVVGSQHFNETLEQVSASLGTALHLSSDGLYIQAPAHDLFLISDHIKMMRSILGDMHRPSTRSLHGPRSPVLAPPPPPSPLPLPSSPRLESSPLLGSPMLSSPSLGPDSPPTLRLSISPDTVARAAAATALKRAASPTHVNVTTIPKSPVLQSLAEAAAAKALKHGALSPVLRPTSPTSSSLSLNAEDPWKAARQKMRHVEKSPGRLPSALPTPAVLGPIVLRGTDGLAARRRQVEEMRRRDREEGILFRKANKHEKVPPLPIAPRSLRPPRLMEKPGRIEIPGEYKPRSRSSSGAPSVAASTSPSALPSPILASPPAEVRPQMDAVYERLNKTALGGRHPRVQLGRERTRGSRGSPSSSISSRIEVGAAMSQAVSSPAVSTWAKIVKDHPERRGSNSSSGHSTLSGSSFRVQRKPIPRESSDSSRDTRDTSFTGNTSLTTGNTSYSSYSNSISRDTSLLSDVKESPREREPRRLPPPSPLALARAPAAPSRLPHISTIAPNHNPSPSLPTATNAFEIPGTFADDVKAIMSQSPRTPTSASSSGPKGLARIKPPKSYRFKFGRSGGSVE